MVDNTGNVEASGEALDLEARFGAGAKEKSPSLGTEAAPERKEGAQESEKTYNTILSRVQTTQGTAVPQDDTTNAMMDDMSTLDQARDRESQITHLIQLAMNKDVEYAVKVAQKAEDYYVLDQLHDRLLADDLHDALAARGLIKNLL